MRAHEKTTRLKLRELGVDLASSPQGRAAVDLAQRLDLGPTDRDVIGLVKEQRLVWGMLLDLHTTGGSELDGFIAGISAPSFGDGSH